MRSVERKEEVYPSRIWEAKLEVISLHFGENLASTSIRPGKPAAPKTMGDDQVAWPTPERQIFGARCASPSQEEDGTSCPSCQQGSPAGREPNRPVQPRGWAASFVSHDLIITVWNGLPGYAREAG
jgi:hypothetical protein